MDRPSEQVRPTIDPACVDPAYMDRLSHLCAVGNLVSRAWWKLASALGDATIRSVLHSTHQIWTAHLKAVATRERRSSSMPPDTNMAVTVQPGSTASSIQMLRAGSRKDSNAIQKVNAIRRRNAIREQPFTGIDHVPFPGNDLTDRYGTARFLQGCRLEHRP